MNTDKAIEIEQGWRQSAAGGTHLHECGAEHEGWGNNCPQCEHATCCPPAEPVPSAAEAALEGLDHHGRTETEVLHEAASEVLRTQWGGEARVLRLKRDQSAQVMEQLADLDVIGSLERREDGFVHGIVLKTEHVSDYVHAAINGGHICAECCFAEHEGPAEGCTVCKCCPECVGRAEVLAGLDLEEEKQRAALLAEQLAYAQRDLDAVAVYLENGRPAGDRDRALPWRLHQARRRAQVRTALATAAIIAPVAAALGAVLTALI